MADDRLGGFDGDDGVEHGEDDIEFIHELDGLKGGVEDDGYDFDDVDFDDDDFYALGFADVADAIGLPDELPALRLPPDAELAEQARSAGLPARLAALAGWVGADGRVTSDEGDLSAADAADAARELGVGAGELAFLWEYALAGDWLDFGDEPDGGRGGGARDGGPDDGLDVGADDEGTAWVIQAETTAEWSSGTDSGVLDAWRATLVSVLSATFDVVLDSAAEPADGMDLDGQGIAMALMLFLARGEGLALTDISEVILDTATADMEEEEAAEARDAWLTSFGDPARLITGMLAQLCAVAPPAADDGAVRLTPLGLWAVRAELNDIGVSVPLLPPTVAEMTAEQLLLVAEDAEQAEFESESDVWVATRDPEQAARELLAVAAADGPDARLLAVSVVTRIGQPAEPVWRESLGTAELRPYAKIALVTLAEGETPGAVPDNDLEPLPEDLAWVATDILVLACDEEDPDPEAIAECLSDSVPAGEEASLFELISKSPHPDAAGVLTHIGQHHPDKRIAADARTAARRARDA